MISFNFNNFKYFSLTVVFLFEYTATNDWVFFKKMVSFHYKIKASC